VGRYCSAEPLNPDKHGGELFQANSADNDGRLWTYLPYGPFENESVYLSWLRAAGNSDDPLYFAILNRNTGVPSGVASYLRIDTTIGVIEVGHINFSPRMQRTAMGTEAIFLMMRNVFDLGYRRYEWKCDALNAKSRRAALRFGFQYEGTFRQATIYKGRNRDTAWFSIIDKDWPRLHAAFEQWLDPSNFDEHGRQSRRLSELTAFDADSA
jgi:RimJ/RimL family protein N-acetyltransferase